MHWNLDLVTFRERSEEGCKYLAVITDAGPSGFVQLIPLVFKSDATYELKRWITAMRSHPAFKGQMDRLIISLITTDNDSVWSEETERFQQMVEEIEGRDGLHRHGG